MANPIFKSRSAVYACLILLSLTLQGCVAASVAGAAVGATAKVAGTAVGLTADAVGAAGRVVTGGSKSK
ncbi:MAG TPA: hypothetical protein VGI79_19415 [Caulobacteraceae bacterium]|jgi:hypothetical protein